MADYTLRGINNQARGIIVCHAAGIVESEILTTGSTYFAVPADILILSAAVNITTVSGTASSTIDIVHGAAVIANEVAVTVAGFVEGIDSTTRYFAAAADITILAGGTTPAAGDLVFDAWLQYIPLAKHRFNLT